MREMSILIVEDDSATQTLLQTIFRRRGFSTTTAPDGRDAITLLDRNRYDLVILDLMMPAVGGAEVLDHLRTSERRPPIVVCTAAGPRATQDLPRDIVSAVIRKPFDISELLGVVDTVLGVEDEAAKPSGT